MLKPMSQTEQKTTLYDRDLNLWLEEAIAFLLSVKRKKK
jgi:hypothetical protein